MQKPTTGITLPKWTVFVLLVLTVLVFANTLVNGFVWDDETFILRWTGAHVVDIPAFFRGSLPPGHEGVWRPVRTVFYALAWQLWNSSPLPYHLQALCLHLLITYVLYLFIRRLFHDPVLAAATALLFAVHPVHTEAVAFVTASFDLFSVLLYCISLERFLGYLDNRSGTALTVSVLSGFLALLSGEMALTLPVTAYLVRYVHRQAPGGLRGLRSVLPLAALIPVYIAMRLMVSGGAVRGTGSGISLPVLWVRMMQGMLHYAVQMVFPVFLTVDYQAGGIPGTDAGFRDMLDVRIPVFLTVLGGAVWAAVRMIRSHPVVSFALIWTGVTLLPVTNIIPVNAAIAERYLYLPSLGVCLLAAYGFTCWVKQLRGAGTRVSWSTAPVVLFGLIVLLFGVRTVIRNADWKDSFTLWSTTVRDTPGSWIAYNNLGKEYAGKKDYDRAMDSFRTAVSIYPRNRTAYINMGEIYAFLGRFDQAVVEFEKARNITPGDMEILMLLSRANIFAGHAEKAVELLTGSGAAEGVAGYHTLLGTAFLQSGEYARAESEFRRSVSRDPRDVSAYTNLSSLLMRRGDASGAGTLIETALRDMPSDPDLWYNRGQVHIMTGDRKQAAEAFTKALSLFPDFTAAQEALNRVR